MTKEESVAYIGAAAWLPQIITWIYRAYVTPRIEVIAGRFVSIGYTRFGPIFNVNLAFTAERKAAIIELLEAEVSHEDGEKRVFRMDGMSETMSDIADGSGNKTTISKEQVTLAFKVGTEGLLEKFVRFQEPRFHDSLEPLINTAADAVKFERARGGDYFPRLLASKDYHALVSFHRDYFWWRPGKYTVTFRMKAPVRVKVKETAFTFSLSQIDIDALKLNLDQLSAEYQNVVRGGESGFTFLNVNWNWRSAKIERKSA